MSTHLLGIRHHGPGSARQVRQLLENLEPDIVLVEGPPEADTILQWATHKELRLPVAILAYQPDKPDESSFYPFAEFSPEWQAILYAKSRNIHVRFIDLPLTHRFALKADPAEAAKSEPAEPGEPEPEPSTTNPLAHFAAAAGFDNSEKWWEHLFEYPSRSDEVFPAIAEAMHELREHFPNTSHIEDLREAHMRKMIRQAEKEMFQNIAVICGAWHVPALAAKTPAKTDNDLLKGLPKVKVECTWVPWTYSRLSYYTGYGAGIASPGWYDHVWQHPSDDGTRWVAKVAQLFRQKNMDTSVAHVIEAVRLAESLAALRQLPKAGLEELNEAVLTVLCNGDDILLQLIKSELIVSNRIGEVPVDIPKPPLQVDIEKQQKKLRLPPTADFKDVTLDLRKDTDLERSVFLHRLQLLNINWGQRYDVAGKGTFKEQWRLQWDPAFSVDIIERGALGNTVEEAAANYISQQAKEAATLANVCSLLANALPAELPTAVSLLIGQINNLAAASGDVIQLMEVIPGLVSVSRYGNVRKTDSELVQGIATTMIVRICIHLPAACTAVDDEAAGHLLELFFKMNDAVNLLQQTDTLAQWQQTLTIIATSPQSSPVIGGYATRLLTDHKLLTGDDLVRRFNYAMSTATPPAIAAAWLEGFLKGSGTLLLIDIDLWNVVNDWVSALPEDSFTELLPLLRRTFSHYTQSERRKLGEKVRSGGGGVPRSAQHQETAFDAERARQGIPVVLQLLGLQKIGSL